MEIHALPAAGLGLFTIGATLRWFEPLSRLLGLPVQPQAEAWWIKAHPSEGIGDGAAGDEAAACRAKNRVEDQLRRLIRYGRAMIVVGVILFLLSALLP